MLSSTTLKLLGFTAIVITLIAGAFSANVARNNQLLSASLFAQAEASVYIYSSHGESATLSVDADSEVHFFAKPYNISGKYDYQWETGSLKCYNHSAETVTCWITAGSKTSISYLLITSDQKVQSNTVTIAASSATKTPTCQSPYVLYQGECVDPNPTCAKPPANSMSCYDSIIDGSRFYNTKFYCVEGYTPQDGGCIKTSGAAETFSFSKECQTYGYYGIDDWYIIELQHKDTNAQDSRCSATAWKIISSGGYQVTITKETEKEVHFKREEGGSINAFAINGSDQTDDNYLIVERGNEYGLCTPPLVAFQGTCSDPIPICVSPPANSVNCIDKIENGIKTLNYSFDCAIGYKKSGNQCISSCTTPLVPYQGSCVDPIPACVNPPANSVNCIDKIENGSKIYNYNFSCKIGYTKSGNQCIANTTTDSPAVTINTNMGSGVLDGNTGTLLYLNEGQKVTFTATLFNVVAPYSSQWITGNLSCDKEDDLSQAGKKLTCTIKKGKYPILYKLTKGSKSYYSNIITLSTSSATTTPTPALTPTITPTPTPTTPSPTLTPTPNPILTTPPPSTTHSAAPPAGFEDEVRTIYQPEENPFPDTNVTTLAGKAATELHRRAVIGGFPDGEFKEAREVNRAGAAKFLLLARGHAIGNRLNNGTFWDVIEGEWYTPFVMEAAHLGIIRGHPDGRFAPADGVQKDEFMAMMARTFNLPLRLTHSYQDVTSSAWAYEYVGIAVAYDLFPGDSTSVFNSAHRMSRGEVAIAIYQYLKNRDRNVRSQIMPVPTPTVQVDSQSNVVIDEPIALPLLLEDPNDANTEVHGTSPSTTPTNLTTPQSQASFSIVPESASVTSGDPVVVRIENIVGTFTGFEFHLYDYIGGARSDEVFSRGIPVRNERLTFSSSATNRVWYFEVEVIGFVEGTGDTVTQTTIITVNPPTTPPSIPTTPPSTTTSTTSPPSPTTTTPPLTPISIPATPTTLPLTNTPLSAGSVAGDIDARDRISCSSDGYDSDSLYLDVEYLPHENAALITLNGREFQSLQPMVASSASILVQRSHQTLNPLKNSIDYQFISGCNTSYETCSSIFTNMIPSPGQYAMHDRYQLTPQTPSPTILAKFTDPLTYFAIPSTSGSIQGSGFELRIYGEINVNGQTETIRTSTGSILLKCIEPRTKPANTYAGGAAILSRQIDTRDKVACTVSDDAIYNAIDMEAYYLPHENSAIVNFLNSSTLNPQPMIATAANLVMKGKQDTSSIYNVSGTHTFIKSCSNTGNTCTPTRTSSHSELRGFGYEATARLTPRNPSSAILTRFSRPLGQASGTQVRMKIGGDITVNGQSQQISSYLLPIECLIP